jgi:hypothetical protein
LDALLGIACDTQKVKGLFTSHNTLTGLVLQVYVSLELVCSSRLALLLLFLAALYFN